MMYVKTGKTSHVSGGQIESGQSITERLTRHVEITHILPMWHTPNRATHHLCTGKLWVTCCLDVIDGMCMEKERVCSVIDGVTHV